MFEQPIPFITDSDNKRRIILNPKLPMSITLCSTCWTVLQDTKAYCNNCGQKSGIFETQWPMNKKCNVHQNIRAIGVCNLCCEAVCAECTTIRQGGVLNLMQPIYECNNCLNNIQILTSEFNKLKTSSNCNRHFDLKGIHTCKTCYLSICDYCTYYPVKGFFTKRAVNETYCFYCMRNLG